MMHFRLFKEEVREHHLELTSLMPPQGDAGVARRNVLLPSSMLPSVVVESHETREARKRRNTGYRACLRKYGSRVFVFVAIVVLLDKIDDWSSTQTWNELLPTNIQKDYSNIESIDDLSVSSISNWCYRTRPLCTCADPLQPAGRAELKLWAHQHHLNKETAGTKHDVDVLFLGDSITERWGGTSLSRQVPKGKDTAKLFRKFFQSPNSQYDGIALGVSGDTSPNLLWRIQNGELPDKLNPKAIWVLIGTNDFGNTWCAPEMVVVGIIRVVEELRLRKPAAEIILNGLLPRTFNRKGYVMRGRPSFLGRKPPLPSLWNDIVAVNDELKHYAKNRDKVHYFESEVFLVDKDAPREELRVQKNLMPDRLHPSAAGYKLWGAEIIHRLEEVIPTR